MFESTPKTRWFGDWCFWLAVVGSLSVNGVALAFFVVVCEWQRTNETPAILLLGYGDSDREGFPIDMVSLDPGAYRQGPQHTPGGDNAPFPPPGEALPPPPETPPEPKPEPKKEPEPKPTVEEPAMKKEPVVEDVPPPTPAASEKAATSSGMVAMNETKTGSGERTTAPLPGAPGGANMKIGTPSAGGTVGTRTGVRLPYIPPPPYPPEARRQGLEGEVIVQVSVGADGYVTSATIQKKSRYAILDNAAIAYVKTLRYIPARVNNVPIATTESHTVTFRLTENR